MAEEVAQKPAASDEQQSRAKILEGVDFIETEEDAEAVESAVVKIQSTFRGKKIRSKLGQKQADKESGSEAAGKGGNGEKANTTTSSASKSTEAAGEQKKESSKKFSNEEEEALNKEVASMQVNDNSSGQKAASAAKPASDQDKSKANAPAPDEDEAERAATKIQAGFKGYKTRKELESKLGQQVAPPEAGKQEEEAES